MVKHLNSLNCRKATKGERDDDDSNYSRNNVSYDDSNYDRNDDSKEDSKDDRNDDSKDGSNDDIHYESNDTLWRRWQMKTEVTNVDDGTGKWELQQLTASVVVMMVFCDNDSI